MMVRVNRVLLALCLAGIAMTGSSYDLAPSPYLAVSLPGDGLPHSFPRNCEQRELQGDGHLFPESKLNGARDLRATYGWAHDSRGLILMVDVADDYLETESGPTLWMGDSIQVQLEPDGSRKATPGAEDLELGFSPGRDGNSPESHCFRGQNQLIGCNPDVFSRRTANGYFIAARIPWKALSSLPEKQGYLSANLVVNDSDNHQRKVLFLSEGIHIRKGCEHNQLLVLDRPKLASTLRIEESDSSGHANVMLFLTGPQPASPPLTLTAIADCGKQAKAVCRTLSREAGNQLRTGLFQLDAADFPPGRICYRVMDSMGRKLAETTKVNPGNPYTEFCRGWTEFLTRYSAFESKAQPFSKNPYLQSLLTFIDLQIPLLKKDAAREGNSAAALDFYGKRGLQELTELNEMLDRGEKITADLSKNPDDPRYRTENGAAVGIYSGFGHGYVQPEDKRTFQRAGMNFTQKEIGPSLVVVGENPDGTFRIDREALKKKLDSMMSQSRETGVYVNLLLSPHYFPGWMYRKYPELKLKKQSGFYRYQFAHPKALRMLDAYLDAVLSYLRKAPYLDMIHSICLTNEPTFECTLEDEFQRNAFDDYLRNKYHTLENLNRQWGSSFASFTDAAGKQDPELKEKPLGRFYDFHVFTQELFASWHRRMADAVHEKLPGMPVHSKYMLHPLVHYNGYLSNHINPERFAEIMDLNGNDSFFSNWGAIDWVRCAYGYALQQSLKKAPVINSENHIIHDGNLSPQSYDFIYTALFEQYMYGMTASATWTWRDYDYEHDMVKKSDYVGSIFRRPLAMYAVAAAGMDAARLHSQIKPFHDAGPEVALLFSNASSLLNPKFSAANLKAFELLSFTGRKIGFLSEKQLQENKLETIKLLIAVDAAYIKPETATALARIAKKIPLVTVGPCFLSDPYGHPLPDKEVPRERSLPSGEMNKLPDLLGKELKPLPCKLLAADHGDLNGIEWKLVPEPGVGWLLNAVAYTTVPKKLKLSAPAGSQIMDLISQREWPAEFSLQPLQPILLQIKKP